MYEHYFSKLGYKTDNLSLMEWVYKGFQSHMGLLVDGIIGPKTKAMMARTNHKNFCPEVFEPIKPYFWYSDAQIESLLIKGLVGLGAVFNEQSKIHDIDVLHNINHAGLESGHGTSDIAVDKNNIYGWACYDSSPYASATKYENYVDCITTWTREYNKLYLLQSGKQFRGNSEYAVNVVYATSPVAGINKSFMTQRYRKALLTGQTPDYLPDSIVPGAPNFVFREGYSNTQINGIRKYKVDPIPEIYIDNAIRVFQNLQLIRNHFNTPVIISFSGNLYRNDLYNIAAGGSTESQHLIANASDTRVVGVPSKVVYEWAKDNTDFNGFGIINDTWIHLDLRNIFWYKEY